MATTSAGSAQYAGTKRYGIGVESVLFRLVQEDGAPFSGGVLGTTVKATVYFPDGSIHDKHTSPPANTLTLGGDGFYRLVLWGEPQIGGHDVDLAQVGLCGLKIYPTTPGDFIPVAMMYEVRPDFDVKLGLSYLPGPSSAPQISGCISIHRWWDHKHYFSPLTATNRPDGTASVISNLSLAVTDRAANTNLIVVSGTDFVENTFDGNIYFSKTVLGITGARVVSATLKFNHAVRAGLSILSYETRIPVAVRFGA